MENSLEIYIDYKCSSLKTPKTYGFSAYNPSKHVCFNSKVPRKIICIISDDTFSESSKQLGKCESWNQWFLANMTHPCTAMHMSTQCDIDYNITKQTLQFL